MLKYKLENLDGLTDEQKAMYQEKDGAFYLQIEGMPQGEDVTGLKNKLDQLLSEKKQAADAAKAEAEKRRQAEEDAAREKGDYEALAKSFQEKIAALENEKKELAETSAKKEIARQASLIAADLAEGPNQEILSTFIERRLRLEGDDLKVTDEKGNLTISTVDQLKEEFKTNPKFGALVIASKASGGGAHGAGNGGGAATSNPWKKGKDFNLTEQGRILKKDPELADRLKKEALG